MTFDLGDSDLSRRVLLIEHDAADRRFLRNWLTSDGCEVFEATDMISGLGACTTYRPDLILLELRLPGMSGFDVIKRIKEDPRSRSIPVIFLSAAASTAEKVRGLDSGSVDFISKPFDPTELQARVRAALRTKYLQDLLERLAHIDGLTGLANRHALEEQARRIWDTCKRTNDPFSALFIDLDHFKQINDRYGHAAGDEVLRQAARMLRRNARSADFVARYGGEELVVLAPRCGLDGAIELAERFRESFERTIVSCHESMITVTASLGVACATDFSADSPCDLLRRADRSVYAAKNAGRNQVWAWDWTIDAPVRPAASTPKCDKTPACASICK